jgi:hypothetical protein
MGNIMNKTIFSDHIEISDKEIEAALSYAASSVVENLKTFTDKFQNA